jgi:hypothetical protein
MKINLPVGQPQNSPGEHTEREPGRWAPLVLFVLVVILALDYHVFVSH